MVSYRRAIRVLFGLLILYSWALAAFLNREVTTPDDPLIYCLTVAPALIFIFAALPAIFSTRWRSASIPIALFALFATAIAFTRSDWATIVSISALCLMLIAIWHTKVTVAPWLINALFLAAIPICMALHAAGLGQYGVFPGQSVDDELAWRVSLFTYNVTPSWLFALVVIGVNYFRNRNRVGRRVMMLFGLYFLLLSGSRTGLIVLALCVAFLICSRAIAFRPRLFYRLFIPFAAVAFVIALNASALLEFVVGSDNAFINTVLFKSEAGAATTGQASTSIVRTLLWAAHVDIFLTDPWVGRGSFALNDITAEFEGLNTNGSEAFLTGLFARTGLCAIFFLAALYLVARDASRKRDRLAYCLMILFAITSLAYGSYIVPYDFVFLLVFGTMNHVSSARQRPCSSVSN